MASTHKHIRSSTANKRPTTAIADGQIALNTNTTSPGLFFKDSTGATIIKVGPVHVGTTAPNVSPPAGGSSGNSTGEIWLDTSLTPNGVKIWNGASWTNATPIGSTTVQGLLELATSAETQTGSDTDRAVTPAGLQSKLSDSTSTTSSTTIASSTAVKAAYDLANAALPKSGGTVTGNLEIGNTGSLSFEGATADAFETTIAVTDPTADRTITLPDTTGTVVTTGDTGTVTSTMIADGTIVNGDINASAAIAHTKLANITAGSVLMGNATNVPTATALSGDVTVNSSGVTAISSGVIVNADVNASAAIAGTKISPDFGSQTVTTTGIFSAALGAQGTPTITFTGDTNTGIYSPGADQVAISTNGTGRLFVDSSGNVGIGTNVLSLASGTGAILYGSSSTRFVIKNAATGTGQYVGVEANAGADGSFNFVQWQNQPITWTTYNGSTINERMRLDSSGRLGLGTSSPGSLLEIKSAASSDCKQTVSVTTATQSAYTAFVNTTVSTVGTENSAGGNLVSGSSAYATVLSNNGAYPIQFGTNNTVRATLDSSGRLGIGTTSPVQILHVKAGTNANLIVDNLGGGGGDLRISAINDAANANRNFQIQGDQLFFVAGGSERARIDSSGRLLVGTSSARSALSTSAKLQVEGVGGSYDQHAISLISNSTDVAASARINFGRTRGSALGSSTAVQNGDFLGVISFGGANGTDLNNEGASIVAVVDAEPFTSGDTTDLPTRLVFSTTPDGSSSPQERMRITNGGNVFIGTTSAGGAGWTTANAGAQIVQYSSTSDTRTLYEWKSDNAGTNTSAVYIESTGKIYARTTTVQAIASERRLKENIAPVDQDNSWSTVRDLPYYSYNFIGSDPTNVVYGPIADEVPDEMRVATNQSDNVGVIHTYDNAMLQARSFVALQAALKRIEALEAEVAALKGA